MSHLACWEWDIQNDEFTFSSGWDHILGMDTKTLTTSDALKVLHPDDLSFICNEMDKALDGIKPYNIEHRMIRQDTGDVIHVRAFGEVIRDENEKPVVIYGAVQDITENKRVKKELKENEKRLELALNGADLGMWEWNMHTGEMPINKQWAEMLGYSIDEIEPHEKSWWNLVHPDDVYRVSKEWEKAVDGKTPFYEAEYRMLTKTGNWKWIYSRAKVTERDDDGKSLRMSGIHQDIDKRKTAEKDLHLMKNTVKSSLNGIAITDLDYKLTYVNPSCLNIFGYENKNEVMGKNVVDFLVDSENCSKAFQDLQNKGCWEGELKAIRKDNSIFDIYVSANWVIGDVGKPIALMASFNDITERKKSEEEKSIMLNSTNEHIVYQDIDCKIKWCNKANADYAGLDPEDFIDNYCYILWYGKDEPCDNCSVQKAIKTGNHEEVVKKTLDGRTWNIKADPVRDSKGNIIGAMQITNEITEKVRAEEKIREYAGELEKINRELEDRVRKQTEQIRNAERTRELELHHRIKNNLQVISSLLNLQSGKFEDEDVNDAFKDTQNRVISMSLVHQKLYQTCDLDSIDINDAGANIRIMPIATLRRILFVVSPSSVKLGR